MNKADFLRLNFNKDWNVQLRSLWFDGKGNWDKAHDLINDLEDKESSWVHAYLHRKEGDDGNARYWYRKAGKEYFAGDLEDEWSDLVDYFILRE